MSMEVASLICSRFWTVQSRIAFLMVVSKNRFSSAWKNLKTLLQENALSPFEIGSRARSETLLYPTDLQPETPEQPISATYSGVYLTEKWMTFIPFFLECSLSVCATFLGGKPLIEELENTLGKKMPNPWIIKDVFLVCWTTSIYLLFSLAIKIDLFEFELTNEIKLTKSSLSLQFEISRNFPKLNIL